MSVALANPKAALKALDKLDAEASLAAFVRVCWAGVEREAEYVHGWHIDAICEHLEAVTRGELSRVLFNVPPGMSKSLLVSVFWPAWEWGPCNLPGMQYITTSYRDGLVKRDNRRMRDLVTSPLYQELWGDRVELRRRGELSFDNTAGGFREGMPFVSLTGSRGHRFIFDDPHSTETAESDAERERVTRVFRESVTTRLNDPRSSAIVGIMQRLHTSDVSGIIERSNMGYEILCLPMEFEPDRRCRTKIGFVDPRKKAGELLFPERFPPEVVERDKSAMGSYAVAGQFQQRPAPRGGGLFKRSWLEVVDAAPAGLKECRGWDLAGSKAGRSIDPSWTAGVKLGRAIDGTFYILHVERLRDTAAKVEKAIRSTASQDGPACEISLPQDPGQAGKGQVRYLIGRLAGYTVRSSPETGDKTTRAAPVSSQAEAGNLKIVRGAWNEALLEELEMFPNGDHDDQVDALSRAMAHLTRQPRRQRASFAGPIQVSGAQSSG